MEKEEIIKAIGKLSEDFEESFLKLTDLIVELENEVLDIKRSIN